MEDNLPPEDNLADRPSRQHRRKTFYRATPGEQPSQRTTQRTTSEITEDNLKNNPRRTTFLEDNLSENNSRRAV
jgi:hypothetical protein